jgi:hypothetical protein
VAKRYRYVNQIEQSLDHVRTFIQDKHTTKNRNYSVQQLVFFNSNNQFVIENILSIDNANFNWYNLIDENIEVS